MRGARFDDCQSSNITQQKVNVGPKQPNSSTVAATNKFSREFGYISFPPLEKGGVGEDGVGECGGPV